MKVAKVTAYGGVEAIVFEQRPTPTPRAGEVLVQVHAAPVTAGDVRIRSGRVPRGFGTILRLVFGWNRPRRAVQGWSFAGTVLNGGGFARGARVFGITGIKGGAHGEIVAVPKGQVMAMPDSLSFEQAAAFFFGGLTATTFLLDIVTLQAGQRILINGATGSVGSAAIEIAKSKGAVVTAVCSAHNRDLALRLGADEVRDYRIDVLAGPFDVILDVIGTLPWPKAAPLLARGGTLLLVSTDLAQNLGAALRPKRGTKRVKTGISSESRANMDRLLALYLAGQYHPLVGQIFAFEDIRDAHAQAETFSKPGNTIVKMTS